MPNGSSEQTDFTKTKAYATLDLIFKGFSAAAVVAIGAVTYLLQQHVELLHEAEKTTQRNERRYLPYLRGAAEAEDVLVTVSSRYGFPKYDSAEMEQKSELGARLAYVASSLKFPDNYEPMVAIPSAHDILSEKANPRPVLMRTRTAMLLLAELLRYSPMFGIYAQLDSGTITLRGDYLIFSAPSRWEAVALDGRTRKAWRLWLAGAPTDAGDLVAADLPTIASLIDQRLSDVTDRVTSQKPDLAKDFVEIRADILKANHLR